MIGTHHPLPLGRAPGVSHGGAAGSIVRGILGLLAGLVLGLIGIATGALLLFLPPIGWVAGPLLMLGSLALPVLLAVYGSRSVTGRCPRCGASVLAVPREGSVTCHACGFPIRVEAR